VARKATWPPAHLFNCKSQWESSEQPPLAPPPSSEAEIGAEEKRREEKRREEKRKGWQGRRGKYTTVTTFM
jgi:hypothetical protein